jgi:uracil-DNA glycosylase
MHDHDPGPPPAFEAHFAAFPDMTPFRQHFWFDWGPIFYRGRLDGTARILCVASDPGPTERIAGRTLVGDAGQRVQGFLTKLGLTQSYLCVNAFAYALFPSHGSKVGPVLDDPDQKAWRNGLFDLARTPSLVAVIAFGAQAQAAVDRWPGKAGLHLEELPHPSSRSASALLNAWRAAVPRLRAIVPPDADGDNTGPNYGTSFREADYSPIPRRDLPFGAPPFLGDDAWGRHASPRHNNGVARPVPDDKHTLIWQAPRT